MFIALSMSLPPPLSLSLSLTPSFSLPLPINYHSKPMMKDMVRKQRKTVQKIEREAKTFPL